jgi:hypothetical protein
MCSAEYGEDEIFAVELNGDGSCYCQNDCVCMDNFGDFEQQLMVSGELFELPELCEEEDWAHLYDIGLEIDFTDDSWWY